MGRRYWLTRNEEDDGNVQVTPGNKKPTSRTDWSGCLVFETEQGTNVCTKEFRKIAGFLPKRSTCMRVVVSIEKWEPKK